MPVNNKYVYRSRISEAKFRQLLKLFCLDLTATQIAELTHLSRNTVNNYLKVIRHCIAQLCEAESPFSGQVEVDESYFGARRARGKTVVFGIFKRNGNVYTEIVPDASKNSLQKVIRGKVSLDSIIHSDGWRGYNGLVDLGYARHLRVDHGRDEFVISSSHINGIEGFWGFAKTRLVKCQGMHPSTFYLHLKESEFRFNYRKENIYPKLLTFIRQEPLNLS